MEKAFERLLSFLELEDETKTIKGKLVELTVDDKRREWFFNIELEKPLKIETFKRFENQLKAITTYAKSCNHVRYEIDYAHANYEEIQAYYHHVLASLQAIKPRYSALSDFKVEKKDEQSLEILCPKDGMYVEQMLYDIERGLAKIGFDVKLGIKYCEDEPTISERIEQIDATEMREALHSSPRRSDVKTFVQHRDRTVGKIKHTIENIPMTEDALTQYKSMHKNCEFTIEASVTSIDERKLKHSMTLFTFVLSDDTDSIYVKKFVSNPDEQQFLRAVKPDMALRAHGTAQYDHYVDEVSLIADTIEHTDQPIVQEERQDTEPKKRIELHLHSKMSTLDGIDAIEDYVDTAIRFKHPAIALTDHNTVQSFPDFFKATKNKTIKPIYGVELNTVDETDLALATHEADVTLKNATYTVFDIETTGLSVHYSKMIEISALKIKNHQIVDRYNTLINPEMKLSDFTKKLTGITQNDVDKASTIEHVLPGFAKFYEGTIMVAHNAAFDMAHLYENLRQLNMPVQPLPTIDTLQIARQIYHDKLNRFNLKAVAKFFKVELKRHHRAEYDTQATADIFMHMLTDLDKMGFKHFKDLKHPETLIRNFNPYRNAMSKHLNVLVKKQSGLKKLYQLVSLAHDEYFTKRPLMPKQVLANAREGLMIGSGCMNSDLFDIALLRDEETLKKRAEFYDFIEIQPFEDYLHLKKDHDNIEQLIEDTLKRLIRVAKELNIPVVATGDVHHIEKNSVKYRDIYIQTPVVGGGYHQLANYPTIPSQYYRTTDEMLEAFPFLDEETIREVVIDNPRKIADLIEDVIPFDKTLHAPTDDFLASEGLPSIEKKMLAMVYERAKELYGDPLPALLKDRLEKELKSITENQFSTVYFISHLLVKKSLEEGYLVGSRGSVGSSLVATFLEITEVNPLPPHYTCPKCYLTSFKMTQEDKNHYGVRENEKGLQTLLENVSSGFDLEKMDCPDCGYAMRKDGHDIPFETFLGFKGDKVPDIDLNFSGDYQPIVHEYIRSLFGKHHAFRAGTISTVADKTAFGYVKGYVEKKQISLRNAEIERRAKVIAGVKRSTGQHPGGIVVVPKYKDIHDITPVQYPADATDALWKTTHFDYHAFEDNLFKLDVLGHDDPTMIRYLMDFVKADPINFPFTEAQDIPLDDHKVYSLLSGTEVIGLRPADLNDSEVASFGVPEMGTPFVRGMLANSRPKTFADIVKISGLSHGTDVWLNNAEILVTGKSKEYGKIPFKEVIGCRDDIMVTLIQYGLKSEEAFEISEFIRRGKASKSPDSWEGYKMIMREHKIPEWYIWSAGQIKYMFPKAHATAYVMMALRIAWFKVHRPIYFYSAYFSKRARDFDLVAMRGGEFTIKNRMKEIDDADVKATDVEKRLYTVLEVALEMVKRGFSFEPVDILASKARDFVICNDNQSLRLPLVALDGLGMKVAQSIIDAREEKPFTSTDDVKERTSVSKTLFDKLDALGAFGDLPESGQLNLFDC